MTKLSDLFPTKPCTRCGGSGRYSWNAMDGDRCYGCSGTGFMWATKRVTEVVNEYTAAVKAARQRLAQDLTPGVKVNSALSYRNERGMTWQEVLSIETTPDVCGWQGERGTESFQPTSYYVIVTLADGSVHRVSGNTVVRTFNAGVSVNPYLAKLGLRLLEVKNDPGP